MSVKSKKWVWISISVLVVIVLVLVIVSATFAAIAPEAKTDYLGESLGKRAKVTASTNSAMAGAVKDDSNFTYWQGDRRGSYVEFDFGEPKTFNTVSINESGMSVSKFAIEVSEDGESFERVYEQDRIERHRLCALAEAVTAKKLRVVILESDASPRISDIGIYNVDSAVPENYQVVGYEMLGAMISKVMQKDIDENMDSDYYGTYEHQKELFDSEKYEIYNVVNLIANVYWQLDDEDGVKIDFVSVDVEKDGRPIEVKDSKVLQKYYFKTLGYLKEMALEKEKETGRHIRFNITFGNPMPNATCMESITDENKQRTIKLLTDFMNGEGEYSEGFIFDGIDIDWEYPISQAEFDAYNAFLIDLKAAMHEKNPDAQLSLAVSTWAFKYSKDAIDAIDRFELMGYDIVDQNGDHGGFYGGAVQAVEYCVDYGIPKSKINLGMGFYGTYQQGRMEQYTYNAKTDEYDWSKNIYQCEYNGKTVDNVYFNGSQMVYDKVCYSVYQGLGGMMVWHMYSDEWGTPETDTMNTHSLAYAMDKALKDIAEWR